MPLFPNYGPTYYDQESQYIRSYMEDFYYQASTINQAQWTEADTDARFAAGDQTAWNDYYGNLPMNQRKTFNFNHIRPLINNVSGHQCQNKKSMIVTPQENGDQVTADQYTKVMMWATKQDNILQTISDAFKDSLINGMSLLKIWVDYTSDPVSGDIRVDREAINSILIDPFFRKRDLSDCRAIWNRSFVTKREALVLIPGQEEAINSLYPMDQRDGKFNFMPENFNYSMKNLLTYDEFYYRDWREQTVLIDTNTGESTDWNGKDEDLREFLSFAPEMIVQKTTVPTVKLAIVVQGRVLYNGAQPSGLDSYPYIPILCYYEPDLPYYPWRLQGMVRGLRDAQYLYNRRKVIELDIAESKLGSGYFAKEDAVVNPKDLYKTGQGQVIWVKKNAQMSDVIPIPSTGVDPSLLQLSQNMGAEFEMLSGVSKEQLGMGADNVAGIVEMVRLKASAVGLQGIFDGLDTAQGYLGEKMLRVIQNNFTPGKVRRIIGEEPQPQFYNKAFGKYDAVVEDGLNTSTQKQLQFGQMVQLKQVGVPISDQDILEAATLQGKQKIIDNMVQQQQAQQQAEQQQMQAQQQIAQQDQEAKMALAMSSARAQDAQANERNSRIEENKALAIERLAEAEKDKDMAMLNIIKAVKEISHMEIDEILKALNAVNMIKEQTMPPQMSDLQQVDRGTTLSQ